MTLVWNVSDKDTGRALDGELIFCAYQQCWSVPIIGGRVEVATTGDFRGAKRRFIVRSEGYVDHEDYVFVYDGLTFDVGLARYWWYEPPSAPEPPEPSKSILPLVALGGLALLIR